MLQIVAHSYYFAAQIWKFNTCQRSEYCQNFKLFKSIFYFFLNVGTPSAVHLFDHLLRPLFRSSIFTLYRFPMTSVGIIQVLISLHCHISLSLFIQWSVFLSFEAFYWWHHFASKLFYLHSLRKVTSLGWNIQKC